MRRAKTGYLPDLQGSGWLGARGQGSFPARPAKVRACLYLQFFTGILDLIKGLESLDVSDSSDLLGANLTPFFWNAIQFSDLRAPVRPVRQRLPRFSFSRRRRLEENLPPLSPGPSFGLATVPCRGASAVGGPRPTGPELGCSTFWRRDARGFLIQRRVEACPEKCPAGLGAVSARPGIADRQRGGFHVWYRLFEGPAHRGGVGPSSRDSGVDA